MLLIYPPVAKPCEAPGGIARLYGALNHYGVRCHILDGNLEGLLFLLFRSKDLTNISKDRWARRAVHTLSKNLDLLRSRAGYENIDRYKRAVLDLNHLLNLSGKPCGVALSFSDYQDVSLTPLKIADLIRSADQPEANPFYEYYYTRLPDLLEKEGSDLVGISIQYLSQALCAFALIGTIRRLFPGKRIVLGGGLVTSWMKQRAWQNPFIGLVDEMIAGPGEDALLSLNGVTGFNCGSHHRPGYSAFPMEDYLAPGKILPYSASSGCYWRKCSFCPENTEAGVFIPVPPEKVLADLQALVCETKPAIIHFLDNGLTPALMKTLCDYPLPAPWYGFARMTSPLTDPDFCTALKRSGCVMLKLGLESGNQEVLGGLHKGIDLVQASQILKNLKKTGISTYVYLLFGTPGESETEARQTLDFVVNHHSCIQLLNLALFNLPAGHPDAQNMAAKPFSDADLPLYADFIHPKGWDRKTVRQFLDKQFRRHPLVADILRRTPPGFTSNHAPFFAMK
jgi:hypothetical protein